MSRLPTGGDGIDRGGLNYNIQTSADLAALDLFLAKIKEAKAGIQSLKQSAGRSRLLGGGGGSGGGVSTSSRSAFVSDQIRSEEAIQRARDRIALETARTDRQLLETRKRNLGRYLRDVISSEEGASYSVARAKQRIIDQENRQRISALRKNIQERLSAEVRGEEQFARLQDDIQQEAIKAREKANSAAALASQRLEKARDQERISALRKNIQERLKAESKVEQAISQARERVSIAQQRLLQTSDQDRIRALRENIIARLSPDANKQNGLLSFFQNLRKSLNSTESQANRISFTFRRLFGILALFTLARNVAQGFAAMVREMVSFNARIEQAELGIASLLTAVGNVRDPLGNIVSPAERLQLAFKESRKQIELLRRDALKTSATFEDLVFAFQTALAPGSTAGLGIDQIREFSVRISQAASALGIAQNQLAEEIRSILQGTISLRTTRIASALGITNEQIRQAREAGKLFEFLQDRFAAFSEAGKEAEKSFSAIFANLRGAGSLVLGAGGIGLFQNLRDLLKEIFDLITTQDPISGALSPSPEAVRAVQAIGDAISGIVDEGRRLLTVFQISDLTVFGDTLSSILRTATSVLGSFIEGAIKGFNNLRAAVNFLLPPLKFLTNLSPLGLFLKGNFNVVVREVSRFATILITLRIVTQTLLSPLLGLLSAVLKLPAAYAFVSAKVATLIGLFRSLGTAIYASLGASTIAQINRVTLAVRGLALSVLTLLKLALIPLAAFTFGYALSNEFGIVQKAAAYTIYWINRLVIEFKKAGDTIAAISGVIADAITLPFDVVSNQIAFRLAEQRKDQAEMRRLAGEALVLAEKFKTSIKDQLVNAVARVPQRKGEIEQLGGALELQLAEIEEKAAKKTGNIFSRFFGSLIDTISIPFKSLFGDPDVSGLQDGLDATTDKARTLASVFDELPGIIAGSSEAVTEVETTVKNLVDELDNAKRSLRSSIATTNLEGGLSEQVKAALDALNKQEDLTKKLVQDQATAEQRQAALIQRRILLETKVARLREDQRQAVEAAVESYKAINQQSQVVAASEAQRDLLRRRLEAAKEVGDVQGAAALTQQIEEQNNALDQQKASLIQLQEESKKRVITSDAVAAAIQETITLTGSLKVSEEQIKSLTDARLQVEKSVNDVLSVRIEQLARETTLQLAIERSRIQAENRARANLFLARDVTSLRNAEAANAVAAVEEETRLIKEKANAEIIALERQIASATTESQKQELLKQQEETLGKINDLLDAQAIKQAEAKEQADLARRAQKASLTTGAVKGLKDIVEKAPDAFQQSVNAMTAAVDGLAEHISASIVDAFDPTTKTGLRERFASFLADIGQLIIRELVRIQIARAALGLFSFFGVPTGAAAPGAYRGGATNDFASAPGFARGGKTNRRHPTDTIPIWTAPNEWVIRAKSVAKYGNAVMDRINRGLVDPGSLQALAGVEGRASASAAAPQKASFAEGGRVPSSAQEGGTGDAGSTLQVLPVVIADDKSMDHLLRNGSSAMMGWMRNNASGIRSALQLNRT